MRTICSLGGSIPPPTRGRLPSPLCTSGVLVVPAAGWTLDWLGAESRCVAQRWQLGSLSLSRARALFRSAMWQALSGNAGAGDDAIRWSCKRACGAAGGTSRPSAQLGGAGRARRRGWRDPRTEQPQASTRRWALAGASQTALRSVTIQLVWPGPGVLGRDADWAVDGA